MTAVATIAAALGFFALVMASIALHEVGHLVPAKAFGIKVTQYMVGFGKTLWSRRIGQTQYGIKALPLGGYVRLVGMYPPPGGEHPDNWWGQLSSNAKEVEWESVEPGDDGHLFHQKPVWQRIVVMAGGPLMNLLLAFVIFWGINAFHGQYRAQPVVGSLVDCVVPVTRTERACQPSDPDAPAKAAGLQVGDRLVSLNQVPVTSWQQASDQIRRNGDGLLAITVERDGRRVDLTPVHTIRNQVRDRLDPSKTVEAGFLGMTPTQELLKGGPVTTAGDMWQLTKQSLVSLATFPVKVWNVAVDLVTGQQRDASGPISVVGASRAAGEVATAQGIGVGDRIASWFSMLASVNLFVCLLNCVPLPPLDGGHIAGALVEAVRRAVARLLGRPDPGVVDMSKLLPLTYLVGGFLLVAGVVLVLADLFSPVQIF